MTVIKKTTDSHTASNNNNTTGIYSTSLFSQQLVRGHFSLNQVNQNQFDPSDVCLSSLHIQQSHFVMSPERLPPNPSSTQFNRMDNSKREFSSLHHENSSLTNMSLKILLWGTTMVSMSKMMTDCCMWHHFKMQWIMIRQTLVPVNYSLSVKSSCQMLIRMLADDHIAATMKTLCFFFCWLFIKYVFW